MNQNNNDLINESFNLEDLKKNDTIKNDLQQLTKNQKKNLRISINLLESNGPSNHTYDNVKGMNSNRSYSNKKNKQKYQQQNLADEDNIDSHFNDLYGERLSEKLDEWKGALNFQKRENIRQNNDGNKQIKALQDNMKDIDKMQYNAKMPQLNQAILAQILSDEQDNNCIQKTEEIIEQADNDLKNQQQQKQQSTNSSNLRKSSAEIGDTNNKIRQSLSQLQSQQTIQPSSLQERRAAMSHKTPMQVKLEANTRLLNQFFRQKLEMKLKFFDIKIHKDDRQKMNSASPKATTTSESQIHTDEDKINNNHNNQPQQQQQSNINTPSSILIKHNKNKNNNKHMYEILAYSSEEFKNGTLNAFKSLQKYDQNPIRLVSCNEVFKKMREENNLVENQQIKQELQRLKKNRTYYEAIEQTLNKLFNQIETNLNGKKKILQDLRIQNYTITTKIRNYQSELKSLVLNYQKVNYELEVQLAQLQRAANSGSISHGFSNNNNKNTNNNNNTNNISSNNNNNEAELSSPSKITNNNESNNPNKEKLLHSIISQAITAKKMRKEEIIRMNQIQQQQEKLRQEFQMREQYIRNTITKMQQEIEQNQKFSYNAQQELEDLKDKKNTYQHMLKEHYITMLRTDSNALQKSMIWLIKALWKINMEVTSSIFPKFLDQESINFLLMYADLDRRLNELKTRRLQQNLSSQGQQLQSDNNNNISNSPSDTQQQLQLQQKKQSANQNYRVLLNSLQTVKREDVQQMIHQLATQNTSRVNKPVYMASPLPDNFEGKQEGGKHSVHWQSHTLQGNSGEASFQNSKFNSNNINPFNSNNNNSAISFKHIQSTTPIDAELLEQHKMEQLEIKMLKQQIADLKQREFDRLFKIYALSKDEQELKEVKKIFYALFGVAEGNQWLQELARLREISFQRLERNKTFHFKRTLLKQNADSQNREFFLQEQEEQDTQQQKDQQQQQQFEQKKQQHQLKMKQSYSQSHLGTTTPFDNYNEDTQQSQQQQQILSTSKNEERDNNNKNVEQNINNNNNNSNNFNALQQSRSHSNNNNYNPNNNIKYSNSNYRKNHTLTQIALGKIKQRQNHILNLDQEQLAQLTARSSDPLDLFMHSTNMRNQSVNNTPKKFSYNAEMPDTRKLMALTQRGTNRVNFKDNVEIFNSSQNLNIIQ